MCNIALSNYISHSTLGCPQTWWRQWWLMKACLCQFKSCVWRKFNSMMVKGAAPSRTHSKCMNVIIEPNVSYSDHMIMATSYSVLRPWVGNVVIYLWNHITKQVTFPKLTFLGKITAANAIPVLLVLKPTENEFEGIKATAKKTEMEGAERTFGQNWLDRIMGLEFGRSKRGAGSHNGICQYICYA